MIRNTHDDICSFCKVRAELQTEARVNRVTTLSARAEPQFIRNGASRCA